jgi:3-hydroxyisobutyrate dehydrogenase-like beta-hydroxyacid dehydrogenase
MQLSFIGLGQMGAGMASSLLAAGHEVTVWNRSPGKTAPLADRGATVAASIAEAARTRTVFTMLADDKALESVVYGEGGLLQSLPADGIHVSCSTISVALSERLAKDHAAKNHRFVAAPVFGRPPVAASGQLFVVAAGAKEAIDAVEPALEAVGRQTFRIGDQPPTANLLKITGNFLIAATIESLGEAMALAHKGGVDRHKLLEVLTGSLFGSPVYQTYGKLIADGQFEPPGFAAPLGLKDVGLALAAGETLRVPLPIASLMRDRFLTLLAHGGENLDWSAAGRLPERDAGGA